MSELQREPNHKAFPRRGCVRLRGALTPCHVIRIRYRFKLGASISTGNRGCRCGVRWEHRTFWIAGIPADESRRAFRCRSDVMVVNLCVCVYVRVCVNRMEKGGGEMQSAQLCIRSCLKDVESTNEREQVTILVIEQPTAY